MPSIPAGSCTSPGLTPETCFDALDISEVDSLEIDEAGVLYQRTERGLVLLDATQCSTSTLVVAEGTTEVARGACARNISLRSVVLPQGMTRIGADAFRGCNNLTQVDVPESLEEIGTAAFCRTALRSIYVPCSCTNLHEEALCIGPVFAGSAEMPYASTLRKIRVHEDNPRYCVAGGVLCQRLEGVGEGNESEGGILEALLCPGVAEEVTLGPQVVRVAPGAFAGTVSIGTLRLHEGLAFGGTDSPFPSCSCKRIVLTLDKPCDSIREIDIELPENSAGARVLAKGLACGPLRAESLLAVYDEAVLAEKDQLAQARHMAARLAAPAFLSPAHAHAFRTTLEPVTQSACLHFGAHSQWRSIEHLAEAGVLHAAHIPELIEAFNRFGNTLAAGFMLDVRRRYFGKALASYDI